jgi:hypothetical protein
MSDHRSTQLPKVARLLDASKSAKLMDRARVAGGNLGTNRLKRSETRAEEHSENHRPLNFREYWKSHGCDLNAWKDGNFSIDEDQDGDICGSVNRVPFERAKMSSQIEIIEYKISSN